MKSISKAFWIVVGTGVVVFIGWFAVVSVQPRAIPKIKLSPFETPRVASNSIWLRLQQELTAKPIWLWGLNPEDDFQKQVLLTFLNEPPGNAPGFDEIWVDRALGFDFELRTRLVTFKDNDQIAVDLSEATSKNKRVLLVTPTPFAASFLKEGPAWKLLQQELSFYSLLFSDFPRRRSDESKTSIPCVLPHADKSGTGDLGCRIQQRARLQYRKSQTSGARVGILDQISGHDFLFLVAMEP